MSFTRSGLRRRGGGARLDQVVVVGDALAEARQRARGERRHEVVELDVRVLVERDVHAPVDRPHRGVARHLRLRGAEVHVGELGAEREHQVGAAHAPLDRRRRERPHVDADVQRVVHREDALREHGGDDRRAELLRHLAEVRVGAAPEQLDAAHHDRALRAAQARHGLGDGLARACACPRPGAGSCRPSRGSPRARGSRRPRGRDGSRGSPAGAPTGSRPTTSCTCSAASSGMLEDARGAGDLGEHPELALDVLHLMVDAGEALLGLARPAGDDQQAAPARRRRRATAFTMLLPPAP